MVTERGGPLEMLTILDLSQGIAGPYAAYLFAQLGAQVIKVEKPVVGDVSRSWRPFAGGEAGVESSLTFQAVNASKLSLTLDYETAEGAAILRRLAEDADGIIDDFPSLRSPALGLGATELISRIPRLVVVLVSAYGAAGPYAGRPLTGLTLAAAVGALSNETEGAVYDRGLEQILGQNAFSAAMTGLWRAAQTEHGQVVDVSGMHLLASLTGPAPGGATGPSIDLEALQREGTVEAVAHPQHGRLLYPGAPFLMSETPAEPVLRAPLLGEHSDYVLKDLIGLEAAEIESLRTRGIV
jgi:crotonobetainyl-CoA:carnitine CoA-transferase CaiB-like acyl-CoA transferase